MTEPQPKRPFMTPDASPFRREVERRSLVAVLFLRGLPKAVPALLVLGVVAAGIAVDGPLGVLCYLMSVLLLSWLVYLSWPALPPVGRAVRVVVIGGVIVMVGSRFFST